MPKASMPDFPLNGLFPVEKPSGPTSMKVIDKIKPLLCESRLFQEPGSSQAARAQLKKRKGGLKIGQGGTLDPLADGVLVIGVGRGTKRLQDYLMGPKEYVATGLLGCSTTTYDSEGEILATAPWRHVTRELIESKLDQFRGAIVQTPPIFSALKMDGKPLYEYARENKPLPRPIEGRNITIHKLELETFETEHDFRWPDTHLTPEEQDTYRKITELTKQAGVAGDPALPDVKDTPVEQGLAPCFRLRMEVSSGTYVRSIIHDLAVAIGSAAHVVTLKRTQQGQFRLQEELDEEVPATTPSTEFDWKARKGGCIPWSVWERAIAEREDEMATPAAKPVEQSEEEAMASGEGASEWQPKEWERELYARFVAV